MIEANAERLKQFGSVNWSLAWASPIRLSECGMETPASSVMSHKQLYNSVLSKARKRWGVDLFRGFFERIVWQCVESGLVDGKKLF